jgi:hypothetical protein
VPASGFRDSSREFQYSRFGEMNSRLSEIEIPVSALTVQSKPLINIAILSSGTKISRLFPGCTGISATAEGISATAEDCVMTR